MLKLHTPIDHFLTSVYHKPTFTSLYTNFNSFISLSYKKSLILSLWHCSFSLCSNYENFHKELDTFKKIFKPNGYYTHFLISVFAYFWIKFLFTSHCFTMFLKNGWYFCCPFTGTHSLQICTQILSLCHVWGSNDSPFTHTSLGPFWNFFFYWQKTS